MTPPIFTGGTGRSGTSITAKLIGAHSRYHMIPIEIRVVTDPRGLIDLAMGECSYDQFLRKLEDRWWHRVRPAGGTRGLHKLLERSALDAALRGLEQELGSQPMEACGRFVRRILDPIASAAGASGWVEMTPPNAMKAGALVEMFPGAKVVHTIRDGRDVAASVATKSWGPSSFDEALEWWAESLLEAASAAAEAKDQVLVLSMEDLTYRDRERSLTRLLDFLELSRDPALVRFFEREVDPNRAHIARWSQDLEQERRDQVNARYAQLVARLRAVGLPIDAL